VSTPIVILLVALGAAALFALAWWSSGRSKGLGRRSGNGDAQQDGAYFQANLHRQTGSDSGGFGGDNPF
jgi:hypothetical protein